MKKSVFLIVFVCLALFLSGCSESITPKVPYDQLSFMTEENPSYIGSYHITRTNELGASWDEYGEWTPFDFSSREVCFGAFSAEDYGVFRTRSDYHWVEKDGCLKLQKKD